MATDGAERYARNGGQHQRLLGQRRRHATRQLGSKSGSQHLHALQRQLPELVLRPDGFPDAAQIVQDVATDLLDSVNGVNSA